MEKLVDFANNVAKAKRDPFYFYLSDNYDAVYKVALAGALEDPVLLRKIIQSKLHDSGIVPYGYVILNVYERSNECSVHIDSSLGLN